MIDVSSRYLAVGDQVAKKIDDLLNAAYGPVALKANSADGNSQPARIQQPGMATEIVNWAQAEFGMELSPEGVAKADREVVERELRNAYEYKYRYEIHGGERSVTLDTLDTAWKDHLYFMDQLKSGIGLVGYAQKDPKVEFRREGMSAFEQMWDRIAGQVTGTIFRI